MTEFREGGQGIGPDDINLEGSAGRPSSEMARERMQGFLFRATRGRFGKLEIRDRKLPQLTGEQDSPSRTPDISKTVKTGSELQNLEGQADELQPHAAPVVLIYTVHDPIRHRSSLAKLDTILDQATQTTDGKVAVFIESTPIPEVVANDMELWVNKEGLTPTQSFVTQMFVQENGTFPQPGNRRDENSARDLIQRLNEDDPELAAELELLDQYSEDGRINILWESIPDREFKGRRGRKSEREKMRMSAVKTNLKRSVRNGQFDEGIESYTEYVQLQAQELSERDTGLAEKITAASSDPDVALVVGLIGQAHDLLEAALVNKKGLQVHSSFADEDMSVYTLPADLSVVKHIQASQDHNVPQLSQLAWYRGMIGKVVGDYFYRKALWDSPNANGEADVLTVTQQTNEFLINLPDMKKVRAFERTVRLFGFEEAVARFASGQETYDFYNV